MLNKIGKRTVLLVFMLIISELCFFIPFVVQNKQAYDKDDSLISPSNDTDLNLSNEISNDPLEELGLYTDIESFRCINGSRVPEDEVELESLKYEDEAKFILTPNNDSGIYGYDIRFYYPVNLGNHPFDYYDMYLVLQIDEPEMKEDKVSFQKLSTNVWTEVKEIKSQRIDITPGKYNSKCERTTEFRVIANYMTECKNISISRMRLVPQHSGVLGNSGIFQSGVSNVIWYDYDHVGENEYWDFDVDDDWWDDDDDSDQIYMYDKDYVECELGEMELVEAGHEIYLQVWMQDYYHGGGVITSVIDSDFEFVYEWRYYTRGYFSISGYTWWWPLPPDDQYLKTYMKNFTGGYLKKEHEHEGYFDDDIEEWRGSAHDKFNNEVRTRWWDYLDPSHSMWEIKFKCYVKERDNEVTKLKTRIKVWLEGLKSDLTFRGYGFNNLDYPDGYIELYQNDQLQYDIYDLSDFQVRTTTKARYRSNSLQTPKCLVYSDSWSSGWLDTKYFGSSYGGSVYELNDPLSPVKLENGDYTILVKSSDSAGYTSFYFYEFLLQNERPEIQFIKPSPNRPIKTFDKPKELEGFEVRVSVNDFEGDVIEEADLTMYLEDHQLTPELDWVPLAYDIANDTWVFKFEWIDVDSLELENGDYMIAVRAKDPKGFGQSEIPVKIDFPDEDEENLFEEGISPWLLGSILLLGMTLSAIGAVIAARILNRNQINMKKAIKYFNKTEWMGDQNLASEIQGIVSIDSLFGEPEDNDDKYSESQIALEL